MSPTLFRGLLISVHMLNIIGAIIWENPAIFWLIFVVTVIGTQLKPRIVLSNKIHTTFAVTMLILIGILEYGINLGGWIPDLYGHISFPTILLLLLLFEPERSLFSRTTTKSSNIPKN